MNGFKLLAIRPLPGCNQKYLKNLKEGMLYKFYQGYDYFMDKDCKIKLDDSNYRLYKSDPIAVVKSSSNHSDLNLFDIGDLKINISAVVGKNGSGKSALFELFFGLIYILAENENILVEDGIQHLKRELDSLNRIRNEFFSPKIDSSTEEALEKSTEEKIREVQEILNRKHYSPDNKLKGIEGLFIPDSVHIDPTERIAYLDRRLKSLNNFLKELKAEVLFELDGNYFNLTTSYPKEGKQIGIFDITQNLWCDADKLSNFFYSIAVNYSIHGLNAQHIGEWINPLFHKNDAYQTPLVINPMRINGDIDINNEEYLAKSRLLSNILIKSGNEYNLSLTENQKAYQFTFRLMDGKTDIVYEKETGATANPRLPVSFEEFYVDHVIPNGEDTENRLYQKIYEILFDLKLELHEIKDQFKNVEYHESAKKYILKKLVKIAKKKGYGYEDYFMGPASKVKSSKTTYRILDLFSLESRMDEDGKPILSLFEEYLNKIKTDKSHITLKLRQAINYLKNEPLKNSINSKENQEGIWTELSDKYDPSKKYKGFKIKATDLANRLNSLVSQKDELIDLLPPSLFYLDIEMKNTETNGDSTFNQLSSGEQQHIHSIHSILYHLNNLNSVFNKPKENGRQTYPNINIMLDEIELYFHPDFQRKFIVDLLSGIERLIIGGSDKEGNPIEIQSINILFSTHSPFILSDIPAQNVLRLENGKPSIKKQKGTFGANVHDLLHDSFFLEEGSVGKFAKKKITSALYFLNSKVDSEKYPPKESNWTKENIHVFIQLVGEPLIQKGLLDLYKKAYANDRSAIQKEIDRLINLRDSAL